MSPADSFRTVSDGLKIHRPHPGIASEARDGVSGIPCRTSPTAVRPEPCSTPARHDPESPWRVGKTHAREPRCRVRLAERLLRSPAARLNIENAQYSFDALDLVQSPLRPIYFMSKVFRSQEIISAFQCCISGAFQLLIP